MISEYINRRDVQNILSKYYPDAGPTTEQILHNINRDVKSIPNADVVEVDDVAKILTWLFADYCPCNYNSIDEWLPYVCELSNECPSPKDELVCWKQFIKHHKAKMDGGAE